MKPSDIHIQHINETCLLITLSDHIDIKLASVVAEICRVIKDKFPDVIEVTPSYTTLLIEYEGLGDFADEMRDLVMDMLNGSENYDSPSGKLIELPVYYDHSTGPDLASVAEASGLTENDVIAIHSSRIYTVCAIGFAPGFAFLAELDDRLIMPRRASPRAKVPAGSVAIAEKQTAVYPADSPGGWHLLGKCPLPLFDLNKDPMTPFSIGNQVKFEPIDRETFIKKGGTL